MPEKQGRGGLALLPCHLSRWSVIKARWWLLLFHQLESALTVFRWFCGVFWMWRGCMLLRSFFKVFFNQWSSVAVLCYTRTGLSWKGIEVLWLCHPLQKPWWWRFRGSHLPRPCGTRVSENLLISVSVLQRIFVIKLLWRKTGASFASALCQLSVKTTG